MQSKKIILSLIAALAFTAGPATASDVYSVDTFAIGTLINGQFKVDSKEKAEACYKILNDETRRLEYILSAYDPDSDVTRLNQHPGEWIQIEPETFEVFNDRRTHTRNFRSDGRRIGKTLECGSARTPRPE